MAHLEFDLDTPLPPARILSALTDFSDRRPDLWPGLDRAQYRVYEVGDSWADVREGSSGSIWARERYDWSRPGTVSWTVQDSSFSSPGDCVIATVRDRAEGGSRVHVAWDRHGRNLMGKAVVALVVLTRGGPVRQSIRQGLERIAAAAGGGPDRTMTR